MPTSVLIAPAARPASAIATISPRLNSLQRPDVGWSGIARAPGSRVRPGTSRRRPQRRPHEHSARARSARATLGELFESRALAAEPQPVHQCLAVRGARPCHARAPDGARRVGEAGSAAKLRRAPMLLAETARRTGDPTRRSRGPRRSPAVRGRMLANSRSDAPAGGRLQMDRRPAGAPSRSRASSACRTAGSRGASLPGRSGADHRVRGERPATTPVTFLRLTTKPARGAPAAACELAPAGDLSPLERRRSSVSRCAVRPRIARVRESLAAAPPGPARWPWWPCSQGCSVLPLAPRRPQGRRPLGPTASAAPRRSPHAAARAARPRARATGPSAHRAAVRVRRPPARRRPRSTGAAGSWTVVGDEEVFTPTSTLSPARATRSRLGDHDRHGARPLGRRRAIALHVACPPVAGMQQALARLGYLGASSARSTGSHPARHGDTSGGGRYTPSTLPAGCSRPIPPTRRPCAWASWTPRRSGALDGLSGGQRPRSDRRTELATWASLLARRDADRRDHQALHLGVGVGVAARDARGASRRPRRADHAGQHGRARSRNRAGDLPDLFALRLDHDERHRRGRHQIRRSRTCPGSTTSTAATPCTATLAPPTASRSPTAASSCRSKRRRGLRDARARRHRRGALSGAPARGPAGEHGGRAKPRAAPSCPSAAVCP